MDSEALGIALLFFNILAVPAVLAATWKDVKRQLSSAAGWARGARRRLCRCRRAAGAKAADPFAAAVAQKLRERRRSFGKAFGYAVFMYYLLSIASYCIAKAPPCLPHSLAPASNVVLALGHTPSIWFVAGYLVLPERLGWKSSWPELCFASFVVVGELVYTGALDPRFLLVQDSWEGVLVLVWSLCVQPIPAVSLTLLYTLGKIALYWLLVPEGVLVPPPTWWLELDRPCAKLFRASDLDGLAAALQQHGSPELLERGIPLVTGMPVRQTSIVGAALWWSALFAATSTLFFLLDYVLTMDTEVSLRALSSEGQLAAVSSILDRHCDAAFQLTADLRLHAPAPRLDVHLNLGRTPQAMCGLDFRSLVASEADRAAFEEFVEQGIGAGGHFGEALYLDLRAAFNSKLRVQMMCAQFMGTTLEPILLCAISELGKVAPPAGVVGGPTGRVAGDDTLGTPGPPMPIFLPREISRSCEGSSSGAGSRGRSRSRSSSSGRSGDPFAGVDFGADLTARELRLEFDAEDFGICSATESLEDLVGLRVDPSRRPSCFFLLQSSSELTQCVQRCADDFVVGRPAAACERVLTTNLLLRRYLASGSMWQAEPVEALCRVHVRREAGEERLRGALQVLRVHRLREERSGEPAVGCGPAEERRRDAQRPEVVGAKVAL